MNRGPLIFLGVFAALAASWAGLVLSPHLSIGRQEQVKPEGASSFYPSTPPGAARRGAEIYRANGCYYCHSQQVRLSGVSFEVFLVEAGTNQAALAKALETAAPELAGLSFEQLTNKLPKSIGVTSERVEADRKMRPLQDAGATATFAIQLRGADIERGWGSRRTVAQDYLYDDPVMLGSLRAGPDLANVGQRLPDAQWHLHHLYAPSSLVPKSTMPPYRYLFEERKIAGKPSADALTLTGTDAPKDGYEIVPKPEAHALVAYLLNQRVETALLEAPMRFVPARPSPSTNAAPAQTNAPAPATP